MVRSDILRAYERFLELPVAVVLTLLWLVGAMLEVSCAGALLAGAALLRSVAGL